MKKLLPLVCLALFAACPPPMPMPEDAGEELPPPAYDGETAGGSIPEIPENQMNPEPFVDAGPIEVDAGCCDTRFHIAEGSEPAHATGRIASGLVPLSNLALTRGGGEWSATACFPLNASVAYRYEFTWDGGVEDGGSVDLEDGGIEWEELRLIGFSARASALEPTFVDVNGEQWNFYRAVESCDGLDGSVP
jgi:hypothetical protein